MALYSVRSKSVPALKIGGVYAAVTLTLHDICDGADEYAPPSCGAAMRQSTPAPVVALPSGGEAPAAPDDDAKVGAPSEKEANAHSESVGRIKTGGSEET